MILIKVLITGSNGMLAKAVKHKLENHTLICKDKNDMDITSREKVISVIEDINPDIIINCAAYTEVDQAESNKDLCMQVNSLGPLNLAIACKKFNSTLIHISTDYVFNGNKPIEETYAETDKTDPRSIYGLSKQQGENNIINNCDSYYILRTSWLFGDGKNFVRTIMNLAKDNKELKVVNDQHGSPTYTEDLASIIEQIIEKNIAYGIYHTNNLGYTTWYDFAKEVFEISGIKCNIKPCTTDEFPRPAPRPKNSKLSKDKILEYGINIPTYIDALNRYIKKEILENEK